MKSKKVATAPVQVPVADEPAPVAPPPPPPAPQKKAEVARILWQVPSDRRTQMYGIQPELEVKWKVEGMRPSGYRVKLVSVARPSEKPLAIDTSKLETKTQVPSAGRYIASVEALGDKGVVLAGSDPIELTVSEAPLLPAMQFATNADPLIAQSSGKVDLQWGQISGAQKYHLTISKEGGEKVQEADASGTSASFANLLPGNYLVSGTAIDGYGRTGGAATPLKVKVPDVSDIQSSQLKKVLVK